MCCVIFLRPKFCPMLYLFGHLLILKLCFLINELLRKKKGRDDSVTKGVESERERTRERERPEDTEKTAALPSPPGPSGGRRLRRALRGWGLLEFAREHQTTHDDSGDHLCWQRLRRRKHGILYYYSAVTPWRL